MVWLPIEVPWVAEGSFRDVFFLKGRHCTGRNHVLLPLKYSIT